VSDSVVLRTTALHDTVIEIDGRWYGLARFERADFNYANSDIYDIMSCVNNDTGGFVSQLIRDELDTTTLQQLARCSTYAELSDSLKDVIVALFNAFKDDLNFCNTYRRQIQETIGRSNDTGMSLLEIVQSSFEPAYAVKEFAYLKKTGVFTDDNGTLKKDNLSFPQLQSVQWFTIIVLTTIIYRDAFMERDACLRRILPRRKALYSINSPNDRKWIIRYFELSDSAIYQRAYKSAKGIHTVAESLVIERSFTSNYEYPVSVVFWSPMQDAGYTSGAVTAAQGRAVVGKKVDASGTQKMFWNLYYQEYGTAIVGNKIGHIDASIMLLQTLGYPNGASSMGVIRQRIVSALKVSLDGGDDTVTKTHIEVAIRQ
jgi:hypothetical protein